MRKNLGLVLTLCTFLIGIAAGAIDARTTHLAVAPAHAIQNGGGGGNTGGCDGHGSTPRCNNCDTHGNCLVTCDGFNSCLQVQAPGGEWMCHGAGAAVCSSYGRTSIGGVAQ